MELVRGYLGREGFEVLVATDGPSAVDRVRADVPDRVILDLMLPGFDGLEVCRQIRGRYRVVSTSGATGLRAQEWEGIVPSLRHPGRLAVVSTTKPWHRSARVGASVQSPLAPTIRLDATDTMPRNVDRLNDFQPESLVAYASMHRFLESLICAVTADPTDAGSQQR